MKRARGFTGGTGDVRPQILSVNVTQATVNQESITTVSTPIQRVSTAGRNMAQVMEILAVDYYISGDHDDNAHATYVIMATTTPGNAVAGTAGTIARFQNQVGDSRVLSAYYSQAVITTSGQILYEYPFTDDLMDGAGHGTLVATDTLTFVISSVGGNAASVANLKIWYRLINVDVMEFLGIVQSQQ